MGIYVDAEDIRQHFKAGGSLTEETVEEIMAEQEYYVKARLGLDALPPNNPILKSIVRDLSISNGINSLVAATDTQNAKAVYLRNEALRKLRELDDDRKGLDGGSYSERQTWENQVYNPYGDEPFFKPEDFDLHRNTGLVGFER